MAIGVTLTVITILLLILVAIWFSSVRIEMRWDHGIRSKDYGYLRIRALYGLLRYRIDISQLRLQHGRAGWQWHAKVKTEFQADHLRPTHQEARHDVALDSNAFNKLWKFFSLFFPYIPRLWSGLHRFAQRIHCERFLWKTRFGTGEAAEVGYLSAGLWCVKMAVAHFLLRTMQCKEVPLLAVEPSFQQKQLAFQFHSIIHFRVGHAILAVRYCWPRK